MNYHHPYGRGFHTCQMKRITFDHVAQIHARIKLGTFSFKRSTLIRFEADYNPDHVGVVLLPISITAGGTRPAAVFFR